MRRLALFFAWLAFIWTAAAALAGDDSHVSFVPWKVVEAGETVDAPLVLYWIPSTAEELRRSRLITSDELMLFSARCVAMRIVRVDDDERLIALRSDVELPRAVLVDASGAVIASADANDVIAVERMVRQTLDAREHDADQRLDDARERAAAREMDAAVELYRSVSKQRCLCPRQARDADRALKKMRK